jgi:hypothetical protein
MKPPARSHVSSSFTLIKGAMVDETYAVFAAWDFASTKKENLDRLRRENFIGASCHIWRWHMHKWANSMTLGVTPRPGIRENKIGQ